MSHNETVDLTQTQFTQMRMEHWLQYELFSFQWWLLVSVFVVPWIIWGIFVDKRRIVELLLLGALLSCIVITLDATGVELHLWSYNFKVFPLYNRLLSIDLSLLPVSYMFLYQWFPGWRQYLAASIVLSLGGAFLAEPLFTALGIYNPHAWKHLYSFPIYIVLAVMMKWIMHKLLAIQEKRGHPSGKT
jgi:hypothetical protein